MTRICDLSTELVGEIFARVPITSLKSIRCTCKLWNNLSKEWILSKAVDRKQFIGFMMFDFKVYSLRFDLRGIRKDENLVFTSRKKITKLVQFEITTTSHCGGLVLCVSKDNAWLVIWNPYLGQIRKIDSKRKTNGYDLYCLGYDNNSNYKILRYFEAFLVYEIYDFCSNSWRISKGRHGGIVIQCDKDISLKGNTYFVAYEKSYDECYLLCFDFTKERFGECLRFPFQSDSNVTLSCVREEKLAVLHQNKYDETVEIWVTNKIEPNTVSWSKFLKFDSTPYPRFSFDLLAWSFFIDEKEKVAVVFNISVHKERNIYGFIIGEDGYCKSVKFGDSPDGNSTRFPNSCLPLLVSSSYVPSLVQINQPLKKEERDA